MTELLATAMEPAAAATLAVLFASIILFITGWLAPEITGLLAAGCLMVTGVLTPAEAMRGFGSPALLTVAGSFALSAGLFQSGGLDGLRSLIGSDAIRTPQRMIGLMVAVVAPLSAFIPNTPIVASLLPVLQSWCRRRGISPSKVLLPLSFVTVMGGTITVLGSSVNLLVSDLAGELGYGSLSLFSITPIGIGIWLAGGLVIVVIGDRTLPDHGNDEGDLLTLLSESGYLTEAKVARGSELVGQTLRNSRLQSLFDVDVLEVHRGNEHFLPPLADFTISAGDRLLLRCGREDLMRLQREKIVSVAQNAESMDVRDPLGRLGPSQIALLRLVRWIAFADGNFVAEERRFLFELTSHLISAPQSETKEAIHSIVSCLTEEAPSDLSMLLSQLESLEQQKLLVKLAFQLTCSNQKPSKQGIESPRANPAYARLLSELKLSAKEVHKAEVEAEQELQNHETLMERFTHSFGIIKMQNMKDRIPSSLAASKGNNNQLIVEVLLPFGSNIAGFSLKELRFRQRFNATVLAWRRGTQIMRERLAWITLKEGDLLLLQAPKDSIRGLQANNNLVVMEQLEKEMPPVGRKRISMVIGLMVILLPAFKLTSLLAAVILGTVAMVASGCLRAGELQRCVRLDVIVLLGSLASFGLAMQKTGLAAALANALTTGLIHWPPYGALVVVYIFSIVLTEVLSNAATVAILIPVAGELAQSLSLPAMAFVYAVLFASSQSFLSPVGYQTNLMVFSPGRYRFLDVTRYGLPLSLTMILLVPLLICHQFHL